MPKKTKKQKIRASQQEKKEIEKTPKLISVQPMWDKTSSSRTQIEQKTETQSVIEQKKPSSVKNKRSKEEELRFRHYFVMDMQKSLFSALFVIALIIGLFTVTQRGIISF